MVQKQEIEAIAHSIPRASYSFPEMAARHDTCLATVYNWHNRGWLKSIKIGRLRRVTPEQETEFLLRFTADAL